MKFNYPITICLENYGILIRPNDSKIIFISKRIFDESNDNLTYTVENLKIEVDVNSKDGILADSINSIKIGLDGVFCFESGKKPLYPLTHLFIDITKALKIDHLFN